MSKCNRDCKFYKYANLEQVDCGYYNSRMAIPQVCAAKELTKNGWENAALEAAKQGNIERAHQFNEKAKSIISN